MDCVMLDLARAHARAKSVQMVIRSLKETVVGNKVAPRSPHLFLLRVFTILAVHPLCQSTVSLPRDRSSVPRSSVLASRQSPCPGTVPASHASDSKRVVF